MVIYKHVLTPCVYPCRTVKEMVVANDSSLIKQVIFALEHDFTLSSNPNSRKGGMVGLAATSIALGRVSVRLGLGLGAVRVGLGLGLGAVRVGLGLGLGAVRVGLGLGLGAVRVGLGLGLGAVRVGLGLTVVKEGWSVWLLSLQGEWGGRAREG